MHLSSYSLNFLTKTKKLLTGQYSDNLLYVGNKLGTFNPIFWKIL